MKLRRICREMTAQKAWITAALLLVVGCAVRLLFLEALPLGLNQDEASSGYDAWALLQTGLDRNGNSWPVLFVSWGSGQNVLMSYLSMPFIALLGLRPLSVRLPNALAGCLSLVIMWRLARRARGERFGLCALFLLVINPWHIMASRWGLESNLLPALLLGACWFLFRADEKPRSLYGAALCLGLAPYAYGTAFFLLPPFLLLAFLRLRRSLRLRTTAAALGLFVLLILPITVCQAVNLLGLEEIRFLGVTFPRLTANRQDSASVLGGGGLDEIRTNLMFLLGVLHNGDDGHLYNALPLWRGGVLYFFGLPLAAAGIYLSAAERRERTLDWPMTALLVSSLFCAVLIRGNINRLNMLWLPMIYFGAVGMERMMLFTWKRRPLLTFGTLFLALACFLGFTRFYISAFAAPGNEDYFPGLGQAIQAAADRKPETLYVTDKADEPYIFCLFYSRTEPEVFIRTVEYANPNIDFRPVDRFQGFEFRDPERCDLLVLSLKEAEGREILETHGAFALCRGEGTR